MKTAPLYFILFCFMLSACDFGKEVILLKDDFTQLPSGKISTDGGAHTEYHFTRELHPFGHWQIASFYHDAASYNAWKVQSYEGKKVIAQTTSYDKDFTHPMLIAGDSLWENYTVSLEFFPLDTAQSGLMFRYRNSRCYYFCGVKNGKAVLKMVKHAIGFHQPYEKILDEKEFSYASGDLIRLEVTVKDHQMVAGFNEDTYLSATDPAYPKGKIGLMADAPTYFNAIQVNTTPQNHQLFDTSYHHRKNEATQLQEAHPKMKLWKKFSTYGFGVGRNLRFGDLNGDGEKDMLIGQVVHHGPTDSHSELSCLTAMTFDGELLWQIGQPDRWKNHLTNDVAFQIHDLDGDGRNEVIYTMNFEIIVADGATGKTKYKAPTPLITEAGRRRNRFDRVLGDCLYFADFRGTGHDRDMVIKDRYNLYWALNDSLEVMWQGNCNTGHYPYAYDMDNDGKDELAIGYTLLDDDGSVLWSLDDQVQDHADGVAIVQLKDDQPLTFLNAASDEGMFFADMQGNIFRHHYIGHAQNPAVLNLRNDLPGLETLSINFWGNQGIIHYYDAEGNIIHDFEPVQHGSMCLPVNWTGKTEEFFVLSPNVEQGGLYDGWGRKAVIFPDDGHPDMCNAVLDITGDVRDEIVVWDPYEVWVYTQDDNPKAGELYQPNRNPLYNYSNYQMTVSTP